MKKTKYLMAIFVCLSLIGTVSCGKKNGASGQKEKASAATKSSKNAKYATGLDTISVSGGEFEAPVYGWKCDIRGWKKRSDDKSHTVSVKNFQIATTETTYETWYEVLKWATDEKRGDNRYRFINSGKEGMEETEGTVPDKNKNHPVTSISWETAIVWCNALSEKAGFEPVYYLDGAVLRDEKKLNAIQTGANTWDNNTTVESTVNGLKGNLSEESIKNAASKEVPIYAKLRIDESKNGFRLPTAYEWVYAARGGKPDGYDWDMDYAGSDTASEVGWFNEECGWMKEINDLNEFSPAYGTKPVAKKKKNSLGLYDMSGNVKEWTNTLFFDIGADYSSGSIYMSAYVAGGEWKRGAADTYSKISLEKSYYEVAGESWGGTYSSVNAEDSRIDTKKDNTIGFRVARTTE